MAHTPEQLDIALTWIEEQTRKRPFGVDVFLPQQYPAPSRPG
jgi:hypothetical protein